MKNVLYRDGIKSTGDKRRGCLVHMNSIFAGKHMLGLSAVLLALCRFTGQKVWQQYKASV